MNAPRQVPQAVIDALMRGDKMTAIKLVRELTGDDLKSAMQMVQQVATQLQAAKSGQNDHSGEHHLSETKGQRDNRARTAEFMLGHRTPTVMPGDNGGRGLSWLFVLVAAALAVWFLFGR
jgi:hypothetical protein